MAEWLCSGLQIRVRRFDPDSSLHLVSKYPRNQNVSFGLVVLYPPLYQALLEKLVSFAPTFSVFLPDHAVISSTIA